MKNIKNEKIGIPANILATYFVLIAFDLLPLFGMKYILQTVAFFGILSVLILERNIKVINVKLVFSIIAFFLYSGISVSYSINYTKSLSAIITLFTNTLFITIIAGCYAYNKKEINRIERGIIIGSIITLVVIIVNADYSYAGRLNVKNSSFESDSNMIMGYLFYLLVYSIKRLVTMKKKLDIIIILGINIISIMTGSRGAMLAILCTILITFIFLYREKHSIKKAIVFFILLIVILLIFFSFVKNIIPKEIILRYSLEYISENGLTGRSVIWKNIYELYIQSSILRKLFGYGIGSTANLTTATVGNVSGGYVAHNLWIDQIVTGGLVGLLLMIVMQYQFIKYAIKTKNVTIIAPYLGLLILSMSLSLVSYKPIWNCMIFILINVKNHSYFHRINK